MSHPARVRERARHVLRRGKSPELDVGDGRDEVRGDGDGVAIARDGDAFRVVIHLETKTRRSRSAARVACSFPGRVPVPLSRRNPRRPPRPLGGGETGTRRRSDEPRRVHPAVAAADPERTLGVRDRRGRESETLGARTHLLELDDDAIVRDVGPAVLRTSIAPPASSNASSGPFLCFLDPSSTSAATRASRPRFSCPRRSPRGAGAGAFADEIPESLR